ncbi:Translin [Laetiporus sulphureus 93-53]|uniref:Translin n=1 Tax=Laetiporus sulphureus 93-53 TaxID=1314785 RepID=A0A165HPV9_9APHY|nr:Translin [Laetiporus sulphureus 93-53]KZT12025.1 Translin [Laetiporus sulphureus 93-53]
MDPQNLEYINKLLDRDAKLREKIKDQVTEFDKKTRTLSGMLNKIHSTPTDQLPGLLESVQPTLDSCRETTAALAALIPPDQFWRWKDMWSTSLRNAVFAAALIDFLRTGKLLTLPQASEVLGIQQEWQDRFALSTEDYLHALISLVNELSRLAVNAVTMGDYEQPIRISIFVKDLFAGFSMLNLRNDTLRRRYDSLKYDIKKIEEVVYDVSLRKLAPSTSDKDLGAN